MRYQVTCGSALPLGRDLKAGLPVNQKLAKVFLRPTGFGVECSNFLAGRVIVIGVFDSLEVRVPKKTIERVFRSLIPAVKASRP